MSYLTQAQTPLIVVDGATVDLTASGTNNHTLTAEVKVSPDSGNQVVAHANGIFVAAAAAGAQTPVTVVDSSTVHLTATGTDSHTVTAAAKISATAGNQITANADGLYSAATAQTPLTVVDTGSIDFTASGTDQHTLTGVVKYSTDAGNRAVAGSDGGIFVPTVIGTITTITASATLAVTTAVLLVDATSGNVTVTMPTPATGQRNNFILKRIDASANSVTVSYSGNIDGCSSITLGTPGPKCASAGESVQLIFNGSTYWIV